MAAISIAALSITSGFMVAEAHWFSNTYYNIVVDIQDYERTEYTGFDLVKMKLSIENLDARGMSSPQFLLGGASQYVDDPIANPNAMTQAWYADSTYAEVRGRGGDVSVEECTSADRFSHIPSGGTGETLLCFMIGKAFEPDGLRVFSALREPNHQFISDALHQGECFSYEHGKLERHFHQNEPGSHRNSKVHYSTHACDILHTQVIPFHDESVSCFDYQYDWCNADNVQPIDGAPVSQPAPDSDPEPPSHTTLLHTAYYNHTGTLVLAFDRAVIPNNPDRIYLIHDVDLFLGNGTAPNLGGSELYTVDGKRQSAILAFALDDTLKAAVTESLREYGYLAVLIDMRAIYVAEGFTDITKRDGSQILVTDVVVVR